MEEAYPEIKKNWEKIKEELSNEEERFSKTLERGIKEFEKMIVNIGGIKEIKGNDAFFLYETYGFPLELTTEMAKEKGIIIDENDFKKAQDDHQQKSRLGADKKFSGGLADQSEITTKYHTTTHLIHKALRDMLGENVHQAGSNITSERLRFDFTYSERLTENQIKEVENNVNKKIAEKLPVKMEIMSLEKAKIKGALAFFQSKYGEQVKVFSVGDYSKEVCGGPHVANTSEIGEIEIYKEESCGAGKRRLYARIINN
jgi:alanyl-tRNA synthetase